jgi:hypothetical protein
MATFVLTGNAATLQRVAQTILGVACSASDGRNVSMTLDDADLSVTYTDGAYGSQKKAHK